MKPLAAFLSAVALIAASPADRLTRDLVGRYDNGGQEAGAPSSVGREARVGGEWIDRQYARFWRVEAPALGSNVIYFEWRTGAPDGPISRQRLWSFRDLPDGGVAEDFYTLRDPARVTGKGGERGAFAALTKADLIGYPEPCAMRFRRVDKAWLGRIRPEDCSIVAQNGRAMTLDVTMTLQPRRLLTYQEAGVAPDGALIFRVPTWQPYAFRWQGR